MVIIVFGLPGSGKSFFAEHLAEALNADYLNSDRIRKEILSKREYTESKKKLVYQVLLQRTMEALNKNRSVVVDATFHKKQVRDEFSVLSDHNLQYIEIWAEEDLIKQRLSKPRIFSDADFDVYKKIKEQWEPMLESHLVLESTNSNLGAMIGEALRYLKHDTR